MVRKAGTPVMIEGSACRWFSPGFVDRNSQIAGRLLHNLANADDESYSLACEALSDFDVTRRLPDVATPLLLAPGEHDQVVTPEQAASDARAIPAGRLVILQGCGHLPPAEDPSAVASTLLDFFDDVAADG